MLLAQLEEIRRNGYAIEREELEYELVCVAVPVLNRIGYPAAAISCSGPKSRMTEDIFRRKRSNLPFHFAVNERR